MALLVLLAGSAGAGIVGIDLGGLSDSAALLLLLEEFLSLLLAEDGLPLLELIESVSACGDHVLVELLFVKNKAYNCIFFHLLDRVRLNKAVVDAVQETCHCEYI